jgi:hypothetical protein
VKLLSLLVLLALVPAAAFADQQQDKPAAPAKPSRQRRTEVPIRIENIPGASRASLVDVDAPVSASTAPACAPPCSLTVLEGSYRLNVLNGNDWMPANRPLELIQPLTVVAKVDSRLGLRILGGVLSVLGLGGGTALMATATSNRPGETKQTNVLQVVLGGVAVAAGLGAGLPLMFQADTIHVQVFVPGAKLPDAE